MKSLCKHRGCHNQVWYDLTQECFACWKKSQGFVFDEKTKSFVKKEMLPNAKMRHGEASEV